jgi:hypothetical protein
VGEELITLRIDAEPAKRAIDDAQSKVDKLRTAAGSAQLGGAPGGGKVPGSGGLPAASSGGLPTSVTGGQTIAGSLQSVLQRLGLGGFGVGGSAMGIGALGFGALNLARGAGSVAGGIMQQPGGQTNYAAYQGRKYFETLGPVGQYFSQGQALKEGEDIRERLVSEATGRFGAIAAAGAKIREEDVDTYMARSLLRHQRELQVQTRARFLTQEHPGLFDQYSLTSIYLGKHPELESYGGVQSVFQKRQ